LLCFLFLIVILLTHCNSAPDPLARIEAQGVLRVAMDPSFPPFEYIDAQGEIQGFDADLASNVARCFDVEAQLVTTNFDGLYDALTVGRADVIISGLYPDPSRTERFIFSEPYFNAGDVLVSPTDQPIDEVAALAGKRVAVVFGTSGHMAALKWEDRIAPHPELISVETADTALATLEAGSVDAAVTEHLAAQIALRAGWNLNLIELPSSVSPYVIAARREDAALIEIIDACLEEMEADGTLNALFDRWFTPDDQTTGLRNFWTTRLNSRRLFHVASARLTASVGAAQAFVAPAQGDGFQEIPRVDKGDRDPVGL
jgi:polar amino acid transport system substrate-binding protein